MAIKIFHAAFDSPHSLLDLQRAKQRVTQEFAGMITISAKQIFEKNSSLCVQ